MVLKPEIHTEENPYRPAHFEEEPARYYPGTPPPPPDDGIGVGHMVVIFLLGCWIGVLVLSIIWFLGF